MTTIELAMVVLIGAITATAAEDQPKLVLAKSVTEIDEGADGTAVPFIVTSYSYDGTLLTGTSLETDLTGDGVMDRRSISTLSYDSDGQRIRDVNESYDIATGALDGRGVITYTYDSDGNRVGRNIETDSNADGALDYLSTTAFAYDEHGNLLGWVNKIDSDTDGIWDSTEIMTRVYNAGHNLISALREVANAPDAQIVKRETWRYTLDSQGIRRVAEHEIDHYADGVVDYSDRTVYMYDRRGTLRASTTEYQASFEEGVIERSISQSTYFYDRHGNQVKVVDENDGEADGIIDQISTTTRTYARVRRGG